MRAISLSRFARGYPNYLAPRTHPRFNENVIQMSNANYLIVYSHPRLTSDMGQGVWGWGGYMLAGKYVNDIKYSG